MDEPLSTIATFTTDDILKDWMWKGKALPPETVTELQEQAQNLHGSLLWRVLKGEVEWFAVKTLVQEGKDENDIRFARLLGNMIQVMENKLRDMSHSTT